ncbi:LacI family DNA-binding transcriptional regulator [Anaerobium acetethylicum]|uniref:LacI family transcriptional regulator n=1 Tax=Anaerobium acetethylicum TaxID=1619234 RepID=A0A1D3TTD2_9FIRM|nr:LacI family DNA-binding transcriptional regulator [Anaerobium acetethylicum]SCP97244.1 LacI family transcriptional regulator [Anaerobium acetethylicum]
MKVKVKDVAEMVGVSPTTVSLVLNKKPSRISEATKNKILAIAQEMQYEEKQYSDMEEKIKIKTVGIVMPNCENMFYQTCVKGAEEALNNYGYEVFRCDVSESPERCFKAIENLHSKFVDGMIIIPPNGINDDGNYDKMLQYFNTSRVPMILLERAVHSVFCDFVTGDNQSGAYVGTEYLIKEGHKKIGLIVGDKLAYVSTRRIKGYKEALEENGLEFNEDFISYGDFTKESGISAAKSLHEKGVTAIFAGNDLMAYGVYVYAVKNGIRIPEGLSLLGYDNTELCEMLPVKLSSIDQSAESMGKKAAEVIKNCMKTKYSLDEKKPKNYYFTPVLIERASVRKLGK